MLSKEQSRPLKSREIAALLSSLFGGMAAMGTHPNEIRDALDHFTEFRDEHVSTWFLVYDSKPK